jgi:hypothetical protein
MAALHHNGGQWHSHCRDAPAGRLYGIAAQCDTVGSMRRWRHRNGGALRRDGGGTAPQW